MNAAKPSGSGRRWGTPVRIVALQAVVTVAVAALALAWSVDEAKSALLGGLVAFLPNAYFAWAASRAGRGGQDAQKAVVEGGKFLARWLVKMGLVVALLVVALTVLKAGSLGFFIGLIAALMAQFAAPRAEGVAWRLVNSGARPRD